MKELPLAIAISALIKNNKILLLKRTTRDYIGLLGLPGGKIEKQEHLSDAAEREVLEESGIKSKFKKFLGLVSEHLIENGKILEHFLLHVCELEPKTTKIVTDHVGKLDWYDLEKIKSIKSKIIPSDYLIIENIVLSKKNGYFDCVLEKIGKNYILRKFR